MKWNAKLQKKYDSTKKGSIIHAKRIQLRKCLMVIPKYKGSLPHFVGVGVGAFGIVDGVVQATGLFALQSLAGNQITHIDHIA